MSNTLFLCESWFLYLNEYFVLDWNEILQFTIEIFRPFALRFIFSSIFNVYEKSASRFEFNSLEIFKDNKYILSELLLRDMFVLPLCILYLYFALSIYLCRKDLYARFVTLDKLLQERERIREKSFMASKIHQNNHSS